MRARVKMQPARATTRLYVEERQMAAVLLFIYFFQAKERPLPPLDFETVRISQRKSLFHLQNTDFLRNDCVFFEWLHAM